MRKHLKVNDWHICVFASPDEGERAKIAERMVSMHVPQPQQDMLWENLEHTNRGTTIANSTQRKIIVAISPQADKSEMMNTISHELRHVVDILCVNCNLENAAELTGTIASHLAEWV